MKKAFNKLISHKTFFNNKSITILRNLKNAVSNFDLIQSVLTAIDNKNKHIIENLYYENYKSFIEKDIIYEIYNENKLNSERLQFIIGNCTSYFNISSSLINKLMKDNNKELLEILFKNHFKFFDNEFILYLLYNYNNKTPVSDSELYPIINDIKYKISTELDKNFNRYDSSYYLFNACKSGNKAAVEFLLEHEADLKIKDKDNRTALARACESGNLHLVKYIVQIGRASCRERV